MAASLQEVNKLWMDCGNSEDTFKSAKVEVLMLYMKISTRYRML